MSKLLDVLQIKMDIEAAALSQKPELFRERSGIFQHQQPCDFQ